MRLPNDHLARAAAEKQLRAAEQRVEAAVDDALAATLDAVRAAILAELGTLTAAAWPTARALDAAAAAWNIWRDRLRNGILPIIGAVFGESFQTVRRRDPRGSFTPQQEYMATVEDRLRIWAEGAFEEIRPDLVESLNDADSIRDVTDRLGRILVLREDTATRRSVDASTRELRGRISEVDAALAADDLDPADAAELKAQRRALWEAHDESLNDWRWKARRVARTETHGAMEGGQMAAAKERQAEGEVLYKRWLATDDVRTRATHRIADGQIVKLDDKFTVGDAHLDHPGEAGGPASEVINCVIGSTQVAWTGQVVKGVTRRRYSGPLVHLVTVDGHNLTVTPNHPVLTASGYRTAHLLRPGDRVITASRADLPDVNEVPPSAEELYRAVSEAGVQQRVVRSGVDFHGDVLEYDKVDVVRADRNLYPIADPAIAGDPRELVFVPVDGRLGDPSLPRSGQARGHLNRVVPDRQGGGAATGTVSGLGEFSPRVDVHPPHSDAVRFAPATDRKSQFVESANDERAADAESARHLQHARAVGMEASELVEVNHSSGSQFVYNLATSGEWYIANGIAIHNCRCTSAILDEDDMQRELQGTNGSLGEVVPGGRRLGPDDPDKVRASLDRLGVKPSPVFRMEPITVSAEPGGRRYFGRKLDGLDYTSIPGKVAPESDPDRYFLPSERATADRVRTSLGHTVVSIDDSAQVREADAVFDGQVPVEMKSVGTGTRNAVQKQLGRSVGQADRAIIDGTGTGLDRDTAIAAIEWAVRLYGADGLFEIVVFVDDGGTVYWRRE